MLRSGSGPLAGMVAVVFFFSIFLQSTVAVADGQPAGGATGEIHHLDPPPEHWQSRLVDERDLQLVIGTDDRLQITPTNVHPYQSIAYLEAWSDSEDKAFSCTATFIGPRTLLTAAHCLWVDEFGGWPDGVAIAPGKDGEENPFGVEFADDIWVPNAWMESSGNSVQRFKWDFGLVTLASDVPGTTVGAWEIGVLDDATLEAADFNPTTSGYPGDKDWGTQWTSTQPAFEDVDESHFESLIDAFQGQSGSAIWGANDGRIVGIVSFETRLKNYALRINERVLDSLLAACVQLECEFNYSIEGEEPEPTTASDSVSDTAFDAVWRRTDSVVAAGAANRTWIWGPEPFSDPTWEPYGDSPGGERAVRYFDKARMEITDPNEDTGSSWYVTNGLLVRELITGALQTGETSFEQHSPATVNVAGDANDPDAPTYETFAGLLDAPPHAEGAAVTQRLDRSGAVTDDPSLSGQGVTAAHFAPETGHTVASVFWDFMNSEGVVFDNGAFTTGPLFQNPFYATGLPLTEPYWATVTVAGIEQNVLIQAFERRVLTYTPGNSEGWQVEAGNVGQHYYQWRYVEIAGE